MNKAQAALVSAGLAISFTATSHGPGEEGETKPEVDIVVTDEAAPNLPGGATNQKFGFKITRFGKNGDPITVFSTNITTLGLQGTTNEQVLDKILGNSGVSPLSEEETQKALTDIYEARIAIGAGHQKYGVNLGSPLQEPSSGL